MPTPPLSDEKLKETADAYAANGFNQTATADALGLSRGALQARLKAAARKGFAPGHTEAGTAPGYSLKYLKVHRDADGKVKQTWECQTPDAEEALKAFEAAIRDMCQSVPALPCVPPPVRFDADLLNVFPMGDPHFGLHSWKPETGEDFDLKIAEALTFGAIDRLVSRAPSASVGLLLNLGDYFHADDSTNRTRQSGNVLDVDGRFQKVASVGFRAMIRCIERMLETHETVIVRNNPGNHDPHQARMLNIAVEARFHDNPRVLVDPSPSSFFYYRFGKTLIGSTHGDGARLADLPLIMANDVPQEWAAAQFRVWHVGHFHHNQKFAQKDLTGCEVETHRTLAAGDAWHRHAGYRALRDMKVISYHREYGEDLRIRCGAERLAA